MAIAVKCQGCQYAFAVKDELAGKRGKCPKCGAIFQVPQAMKKPGPTAPRPLAKPSAPALATSGSPESTPESPAPAARPQRKARFEMPLWAWFVLGGVALVSALGATLYIGVMQRARNAELEARQQHRPGGKLRTDGFAPPPPAKRDVPKPLAGSSTSDIVEYAEYGVVKIETADEWNNRVSLGSGFVIDPSGIVATNYHVVEDAVEARVLFNDGTRYGIEGYLALAPESDLVLLQLNGTPPNMKALELAAAEPRKAGKVYALGHPQDNEFVVTDGIVSRIATTAQLPEDSQAFLNGRQINRAENVWIAHTAQISPGNSGGPLIDETGSVIGVNTWHEGSTNLAYAVGVAHLRELRGHLFAAPEPLKSHRRPPPTLAQMLGPKFMVSAERIAELQDKLAAQNWLPAGAETAQSLHELALQLFLCRRKAAIDRRHDQAPRGFDVTIDAAAQAKAEETVQSLGAIKWPGAAEVSRVNGWAQEQLRLPLRGVLLLGTVQQFFAGQQGRNGLLVALGETATTVFVPLEDPEVKFEPGKKLLIVGMTYGANVHHGENPLSPQASPVVASDILIDGQF
ncbi:MAG: trypsin-like peptidase domain-containing protein [Pirellulales bacterium]|nr:trypsin-like peptidase domain-containing protein [Pirellulales bacterium]